MQLVQFDTRFLSELRTKLEESGVQGNMKSRKIVSISVSLIISILLLLGLMYYFNEVTDSCPIGTFPCHNSTVCKPQRSWCNGIEECPNGDDELDEKCFDFTGDWSWFMKERHLGHAEEVDCEGLTAPVGCTYNNCHATCVGYSNVPQNLSPNIDALFLTDNSITRIPANALSKYSHIRSLYLDNNDISEIDEEAFASQKKLIWLVLSNNNIEEIQVGHFVGLPNLETLRADGNRIKFADLSDLENSTSIDLIDFRDNLLSASTLKLPPMPHLREILLDQNRFELITADMFAGTPALKSLSLERNAIKNVDGNALKNLRQLIELNLAHNYIRVLARTTFESTTNLTRLSIGYNPMESLSITVLEPLKNLKSLGLEEIDLDNLKKDAFNSFEVLEFVYFKKFHYCMTYAPKVQKCSPTSDGLSSLSHLLGKATLRVAVWGISCATCIGNALVLWERFTAKDENRVLSILIKNLAVSDLLMGVYLFVIAVEDTRFRDSYNQVANAWMSSWWCTVLGVLAMTSSEVSVLILSFISVERFILIAAPLKGHRAMTAHAASTSMMLVWIIGITIAVVPVVHWRNSTRFYGLNGMCFPLHIDDPYLIGWQYSAFIFLGLNLLGLLTIAYAYTGMFTSIRKTRHATPLSAGDSEFALKFFFIVLTNAFCWAPIIVLKILALAKCPVPGELHAWVIVFILPINSAINPLLYTFTTPKVRERLLCFECWNNAKNYVRRKYWTSRGPQTSIAVSNIMLSLATKKKYNLEDRPPLTGLNNANSASK